MHCLHVIEASPQTNVSVDALAHSKRKGPVLPPITYGRDMSSVSSIVIFGGEPRHNRFIILQPIYGVL